MVRSYTWGANGLISDYSAAEGGRYYLFNGQGSTFGMVNAAGTLLGVAATSRKQKRSIFVLAKRERFACEV